MFRPHTRSPIDDTESTPPTRGLNNSGGTGVQGASTSDRAGSLSSSSPISATAQDRADTIHARDPLTDPRAGDIVVARDGGVIEVVDVLLGRDATVWVREDSSRFAWTHGDYRRVVAGGSVVHRAEGS